MSYFASQAAGEAFGETKKLLITNFKITFWLKLALVVVLLGLGIGGGNNFQMEDSESLSDLNINFTPILIGIILLVILFLILLSLFLRFISSVFQFVFLQSLVEKKIQFRAGFSSNKSMGFSLFLFNIAVGIIFFIDFIDSGFIWNCNRYGIGKHFCLHIIIFDSNTPIHFPDNGLTHNNFLYKRFCDTPHVWIVSWGTGFMGPPFELIKKNLGEFLIFLLLKVGLGLIGGILGGIIGMVIFFSALILLGIFGVGAGLGIFGLISLVPILDPIKWVALVAGVLALIPIFWGVSYIITVATLPISVFFRYYGLFFIQHIHPKLNLIKTKTKTEKQVKVMEEKDESIKVY